MEGAGLGRSRPPTSPSRPSRTARSASLSGSGSSLTLRDAVSRVVRPRPRIVTRVRVPLSYLRRLSTQLPPSALWRTFERLVGRLRNLDLFARGACRRWSARRAGHLRPSDRGASRCRHRGTWQEATSAAGEGLASHNGGRGTRWARGDRERRRGLLGGSGGGSPTYARRASASAPAPGISFFSPVL